MISFYHNNPKGSTIISVSIAVIFLHLDATQRISCVEGFNLMPPICTGAGASFVKRKSPILNPVLSILRSSVIEDVDTSISKVNNEKRTIEPKGKTSDNTRKTNDFNKSPGKRNKRNRQKENKAAAKHSTDNEIRNNNESEMEKNMKSSDRLSKARMLLEEFSCDPNDLNSSSDPDLRNNGFITVPSSDAKINKPKTEKKMNVTDTINDISSTVPDNVWYNGNLQQGKGDYVTRWARGVKVAEPLRKYDPIAAEKLLFSQPTKWIVRNVQIGFPLAIWAVSVAGDVFFNLEEINRKKRAKELLQIISGLGPAIIKGGQALSSRSDLMPSEYLEELQKLQDDVPRYPNDQAFATVKDELGVEFDDVFELIGSEPVAAASIGQVYKARLRSNGELVAIKIQRPKCEEIIALDLYVLRWWSGVANILTKLLDRDIDVQSIIDDFGELIYRELDYVAEAANAQRFSELYGSVTDVFVPKVYSELTTSKVLTMEWIEGVRLTDIESLDNFGLDRQKLIDTLLQCSLRQILGNGKYSLRNNMTSRNFFFLV